MVVEQALTSPGAAVGVVVLTAVLIWAGSGWLERGSATLATEYGIPPSVRGSVLIAVGSSVPELVSVIVTALSGSFEMGVGAIVGSAIFNVLVIPALSGLSSGVPVSASRTVIYKEVQFYLIAIAALLLTFAMAAIYYPVDGAGPLGGTITRPLAAIPLALYVLYLFVQWQDVDDAVLEEEPTQTGRRGGWALVGVGLVVIIVGVELLVDAVKLLAATVGLAEFLAGVIVIAAVTSLPDALMSVRAARQGDGAASLGNVLGSNTFDLLVAIPIGVMIVGTTTVSFGTAAPMFGALTLASVLLFTFVRTDLQIRPWESYLLLVSYLLFVLWVVGGSVGLLNLTVTG